MCGNEHNTPRQVPLILAWAMSIHKSQGQTIQRVKVDLGKVFEKGTKFFCGEFVIDLHVFDQVKVMSRCQGQHQWRAYKFCVLIPRRYGHSTVCRVLFSFSVCATQVVAHPKVVEWSKTLELVGTNENSSKVKDCL